MEADSAAAARGGEGRRLGGEEKERKKMEGGRGRKVLSAKVRRGGEEEV